MASAPDGAVLKTLLVSDLVASTRLIERLGDAQAAEVSARHDRLARDLLAETDGLEIDKTDGFLLLFERPVNAVRYAVSYLRALAELGEVGGQRLEARIGIHLGEVHLRRNTADDIERGAKPLEVEGLAKVMAARLMSLASGSQVLVTRGAFDLARRASAGGDDELSWMAHGAYRFKGVDEGIDVFEIGVEGLSALEPPVDTEKARRLEGDGTVTGWRPGPGLRIPDREHWRLERKLGTGGQGEVWLAEQDKTGNRQVFKFCFDEERREALQREITIFRLLRESLGERQDISRVLDWSFDSKPYFIELEYTEGGDLAQWAESQGGIGSVPLEVRLEIVAQAAEALAAAHSVGVLHKDVKPANLLIFRDVEGRPRVRLTDFGIGTLADSAALAQFGITVAGLGETDFETTPSLTGSWLYLAPELAEGRDATVQADIYALGVILYQLVVGDLSRALAPGWERRVDDEILREDIALMVDGSPARRPGNALRVGERLRTLEARRQVRQEERREKERARELQKALRTATRRRRVVYAVAAGLAILAGVMAVQSRRIAAEARRANLEAEAARQVSEFLVDLFATADPSESLGEEITAREMLDRGALRISSELADQPLTRARLQQTMGRAYFGLGLFASARPLVETALEERRGHLEPDAPEVLESLTALADLDRESAEYAAAEALYREVLEIREGTLGEDDPEVAFALNGLAVLLTDLNRLDEAEALRTRALGILEQQPGMEAEVGQSLYNRGTVEHRRGRYREAEADFGRALAIQDRVLPPDHPERALTLMGLATAHSSLGDYERSRALYDEALAIQERVLGPEHPRLADSIDGLAILLDSQGKHELSEGLFLRALGIREIALPATSPTLGYSLVNLAVHYKKRGLYDQAGPLYQRAIGIFEASLGPESWEVGVTLHNHAELLRAIGNFDQAEAAYLRSERVLDKALEANHPTRAVNHLGLGNLYRDTGRPREAETYYRQALTLREEQLGVDHPETLEVVADYAAWMRLQGRDAEARALEGRLEAGNDG